MLHHVLFAGSAHLEELVFGLRSILIEFGEAYYVAQPVTVPLGIYFIMQVQVLRQVGQSAD